MEYVDVCVLHDGKIVDNELPNDNVWVEGATLQIDKECYNVELNVPSVTSVKLPEVIISGFPCFPKLKVEFIDLNCCELTWYRELLEKETVSGKEKGGKKREISWERVHVAIPTYRQMMILEEGMELGITFQITIFPNPIFIGNIY